MGKEEWDKRWWAKLMRITGDFYPSFISLEVSGYITQVIRKTWREKTMGRKITEAHCGKRRWDYFVLQINFSGFMNTKEQEDAEVLFKAQWNYNSYDLCNPVFPLPVTNAIFCRWLSENVRECEKSHVARQLLTEYLSEALEWELLSVIRSICLIFLGYHNMNNYNKRRKIILLFHPFVSSHLRGWSC